MKKVGLILFILACVCMHAQISYTYGNLIRYNFSDLSIDTSKVIWNWTNIQTGNAALSQSCIEEFTLGTTTYLLTFSFESTPWIERRMNYLYNNTTKTNREVINMLNWIDPLMPYLYTKPIVELANGGAWVFFGCQRNAFYVRNDSIYEGVINNKFKIVHLAGKNKNKHFLVVDDDSSKKYSFYLADLSRSPNVNLDSKIELDNLEPPMKMYGLNDSLFLFKRDLSSELFLTSFINGKLNLIKKLKPETSYTTFPDMNRWFFGGNNVYYINNAILYKETFDFTTQSLIDKKTLLNLTDANFINDETNNYLAFTKTDSLFVYSINKQEYERAIPYMLSNNFNLAFITAPNLFLTNKQKTTDIKTNENIPVEYYLGQNYPNPFNPETIINYSISKMDRVKIKLYNLIGKELATLVDEVKQPGNYSVILNINRFSLSSGVYFYSLSAENFTQTKKMIILK